MFSVLTEYTVLTLIKNCSFRRYALSAIFHPNTFLFQEKGRETPLLQDDKTRTSIAPPESDDDDDDLSSDY